jgi:hypothetical protein
MRVYTDHGDDTTAGILTLAYDMYVEGRIDRKEN